MHKHQCQKCGTVWQHDDSCSADDQAHKCPRCQRHEWNRYTGKKEAEFTNHRIEEETT